MHRIVDRFDPRFAVLQLFALTLCAQSAQGAVIVVTNRAADDVQLTIVQQNAQRPQLHVLAAGDCRPLRVDGPVRLQIGNDPAARIYRVNPFEMYYVFRAASQGLQLGQIALDAGPERAHPDASVSDIFDSVNNEASPQNTVIPVKILTDQAEVTQPAEWERRIRGRIKAASSLFARQCFVTFEVTCVERWATNPDETDVRSLLADFERKVDPAPARLAIAFCGRALRVPPDGHLGGTRGPLRTHLIVREWAIDNTESERLELLVHELGHFLGAAHSAEPNSVMRPSLGDRLSRAQDFKLVFDPPSTLAMCYVSRELQLRPQVRFGDIEPGIRRRLLAIYAGIGRVLPQDPAAADLIRQLNSPLEKSTNQ